MSEKCSSCFFWANDNVDISGQKWSRCRVEGPTISSKCIDSRRDIWVGSWPWTKDADWCGSWKQRAQAARVSVGSPLIED